MHQSGHRFKIKHVQWEEIRGDEQRNGVFPCIRKTDLTKDRLL